VKGFLHAIVALLVLTGVPAHGQSPVRAGAAASVAPPVPTSAGTLADAQRSYFNARYDRAAAEALALAAAEPESLPACELLTSAILFQIKSALGGGADRKKALVQCPTCPALMAAFERDTDRCLAVARRQLTATPGDETALFYLGKLDLNYVWLHLGTLGRKTGWSEYWEARKSLDAVLAKNPAHGRARVARAWIDYIVDTRMPRMTKWVLGGGNKKRALQVMKEAAAADAEFFVHAEAMFALWDLQVREENFPAALEAARIIARDFPENPELARFIEKYAAAPPLK
jgi:hypothetical protein